MRFSDPDLMFACLASEICPINDKEFEYMLVWTTRGILRGATMTYWWLCPIDGEVHEVGNDETVTADIRGMFVVNPQEVRP